MRKIRAYLLAAAMAVCSCVNPLQEPEPSDYPEGAQVTIRFTVAAEGLAPKTKAQALGEDQPLQSLHLAVFGSSGYLKEYVEATVDDEATGRYADFVDPNNPENIIQVPLYSFTAKLTLTDSWRIIHFIGNGPPTLSFGYADAVLSSLLSSQGERAYWQMMTINGIHAQKDDDGDYIDADGNKITNGDGYVVATATQEKFSEIPLVRNWAKILVQTDTSQPEGASAPNDPFFELISYAVVHVPNRGTLAPHSAATNGFIADYQKKTFLEIVGLGYPANLPPGTQMDETIPSIDDFKYWDPEVEGHGNPSEVNGVGWRNGVAPAGQYGAVYLYERPVPSEQLAPTFVIVYGIYKNPDDPAHYGQKCFYKIDLMTDRQYYPVYRNFQYRILIHSILSFGHPTPQAAAAAAGSADVSADINARHLPDISDGFCRLAIQNWMAKTFTDAQDDNTELSAYFMSDVTSDSPNMESGSVTVEPLPMKRGVDEVITSWSIDDPDPNVLPGDPSYGWRTIHFATNGPSSTIRTQTLRVTGTSGEGDNRRTIYRDIVITIQNKQPMLVRCSESRIQDQRGTPVDLYVSIPDGLPESMFPLEFKIEPEEMTLTPKNDNLPVDYGESLSGSGKPAFHFIKSLSWDEYTALPTELDASDKLWRRITCHFASTQDNSATRIWVENKKYFNPASTQLSNFADKSFWNLCFREPILRNTPHQYLTLDFDVANDPELGLPEVELMVDGLVPEAREGFPLPAGFTQVSDVGYRFTPTSSHVTICFYTTDADGEVFLQLSAEDYESQSLRTHHFTLFHGVGFYDGHATTNFLSGWSNVVYKTVNSDQNKNVLFGYFDDPEARNATISLIDLNGLSQQYPAANKYPWTPDGPKSTSGEQNYHELEFKTSNNDPKRSVGFVLSSPGYLQETVSASRFRGRIYTYQSPNNNLKSLTYQTSGDNTYFGDISFSEAFHLNGNNSGIWLEPGESGTISFTPTDAKYKLFYLQLNIGTGKVDNVTQRLFPKNPDILEGSTFEKYPGSDDQCIWILPEHSGDASITITAEENRPVLITGIVVKAFWRN
jgi:hypothetical protein